MSKYEHCCVTHNGIADGSQASVTRGRMPRGSDRLELLERLPAALAVAERAARRRAEDVLERRLRRVAVRTAEDIRLQLHELRCGGFTRGGRREPGGAQLLASRGGDLVGRPRIVL